MAFFDDIIKRLFPGDETPKELIHESLERTERELSELKSWKNSADKDVWLNLLTEQWELSKNDSEDTLFFRVMKGSSSNGIMIRRPEAHASSEFRSFFDYLAEQIRTLGYINYLKDVKIGPDNKQVKKVERYYMKPSWRKLNPPREDGKRRDLLLNQLYGNISLELHYLDDEALHVQLLCNHYSDSKFEAPKPFDELVNHIFA